MGASKHSEHSGQRALGEVLRRSQDDPSITQPQTYRRIRTHPTTLDIYERQLLAAGVLTAALAIMRGRDLEFISANPDLIVDVGGVLLPCAGTLGQFYEQLGGAVYWAGKPYAPAYHQAFETLAQLAGGPVDRSRILAIGDALRTDIAGAAEAGLDALLIAQGIHRDDLMPDGRITPERLHRVLASVPASHIATLVGAATELAP
jgi:ribonucleotide monophosphatase NagD (HAD superfamily)